MTTNKKVNSEAQPLQRKNSKIDNDDKSPTPKKFLLKEYIIYTTEGANEAGVAAPNHAPKIGDGLAAGVVQVKANIKP